MTTLTRRDVLRVGSFAALGSFLGCASNPTRTAASPPPYLHPEFAGVLGVAREDITPPIGIFARNWGAAKHDVAEGIHQPLTATALTLQGDGPPLVLVAIDLGWWRATEDERHVKDAVLQAFKLD